MILLNFFSTIKMQMFYDREGNLCKKKKREKNAAEKYALTNHATHIIRLRATKRER